MRTILFVPDAWNTCLDWHNHDTKTLKRINMLIRASACDPFAGIGKPEPLIGVFSGYWSRRIDDTNRLIYRATDSELIIVACRFYWARIDLAALVEI